ncbi:MAG: restriction endonuclease subunit S [Thiomicrorhabdus sp.]|nr:restriction endonuclease subunit S [Thiomicrorhabdus sp.]
MNDKNNENLPEGWRIDPIEKLLLPFEKKRVIGQGWSPQCEKEPSQDENQWGVLKTTSIQMGEFLSEHNKRLPDKLSPRPQHEVRAGDILLTCAGPRNRCGVACLVRRTRKRLMISGKMYRFRANTDSIDPRYLEAYLQSAEAQAAIDVMKTGGNESGLNLTHGRFRELLIPVAPLEQQNRIVAEIEKQLSRLDEAVANLKRVKANLKRYKAAVLKAAVEGKLAEERRKQHPDVEPASKLLERILAERRQKWEEAELAKMKAKGKIPKDDKWKEKYKAPFEPDNAELPKLPEGWCWVTNDTISFVTKLAGFEYTKFVKYDDAGNLAVLKAENAGKDGFKRTEFSKVKSKTVSQLTRSQIIPGDLLMVFVGAGTGNVARVPDDQPYFLGPNIGMIRVESQFVLPEYLELFLRSPLGNSLALGFAKAVAQPSLSMGSIRKIPLAVPPLNEQKIVVAELERLLSNIDETGLVAEANLKRAERLRQSILGQAFSGELSL